MNKLTTEKVVLNLLSASTSSFAIGAAIETGLLGMLAEKPMSDEEISRAEGKQALRMKDFWIEKA